MRRIFFCLSFVFLCRQGVLRAQAPAPGDSAFYKWKNTKDYPYDHLHFYFGIGRSLKLQGAEWEQYRNLYPQGVGFFGGSFQGQAEKKSRSSKLNLSLEYNVTRKLRVGIFLLPNERKEFEGGKGINGTAVFVFDAFMKGTRIREKVTTNAYGINAGYVIVPYKQIKKLGFEISGGLGGGLNQLNVSTTLFAYDSLHEYNGSTMMYETKFYNGYRDYSESKKVFFAQAHLTLDIFIGKYFSLTARLIAGYGNAMNVAEKSFTVKRETATVPARKENIQGIGGFIGVAAHLPKPKKQGPTIIEFN